jgi:arsenate reductase
MIKIYHNNRCRKSREAVQYLKEKKIKFTIIEYLKENLSIDEMLILVSKLNIEPINLVRKNENIWKKKFKNLNHSDIDIIKLLISHPNLIERPIIEDSNKAVIGRPLENLINFLKSN